MQAPTHILIKTFLCTLQLLLLLIPVRANAQVESAESLKEPSIDSSTADARLKVPPQVPMTDVEKKVLEYLEKGDSGAASKFLTSAVADSKESAASELLFLRSYLRFQTNDYKNAIRDLEKSISQRSASVAHTDRYQSFQLKCLGDCYYRMKRKEDAVKQYEAALQLTESKNGTQLEPLQVALLEPLTSCLVENGDLAEAQIHGEQLVSHCENLARDRKLLNSGPLFWSKLQLYEIYRQQGKKEKAQQFRTSFAPLLDSLMSLSNKTEAPLSFPDRASYPSRLKTALLAQFVEQYQPSTLSEYLWVTSSYRLRSLPLLAWEPPGHEPTAAILCVHALGLENRVFEPYAAEMTKRNFVVYAIDARGFGAWQSEFGSQTINFEQTVSDIRAIIGLIKERSPGLPVFLLGESMGGGIALRAAADFGSDVSGVIASVPSAERYGEGRMSFRVATHLLRHPNRPYFIGSKLVSQATSNEELQGIWDSDPKARKDLSPIELIHFNNFMLDAKEKCKLIKDTPVLLVQGLADKLVKPKGTYEMFVNVVSPDKTMLLIGDAEHLIFETPNQSKVLLDGSTAWLNNHVAGANQ